MNMNYNVRFIVMDGSVCLHLLIPQYSYLALTTRFYRFWYMLIPAFPCIS